MFIDEESVLAKLIETKTISQRPSQICTVKTMEFGDVNLFKFRLPAQRNHNFCDFLLQNKYNLTKLKAE